MLLTTLGPWDALIWMDFLLEMAEEPHRRISWFRPVNANPFISDRISGAKLLEVNVVREKEGNNETIILNMNMLYFLVNYIFIN